MTFIADLHSQWWYNQVKAIFDAAGVPEYLWAATIADEDSSLNPSIVTPDPTSATPAVGLFQLRQPGLGSGYTLTDLEDPIQNAKIAAAQMAAALKANPTVVDPVARLRLVEEAGWPGNDVSLGPQSVLLQEEPKRVGLLYSVLQDLGLHALAGDVLAEEGSSAANAQAQSEMATGQTDPCNGPALWPCLPVFVNGVLKEISWLTVALALFAGGIALMAGRGGK